MLVLDEEIPFPLNSGKRIRTWNLLLRLAPRHRITFVCYGAQDDPGLTSLQALGVRVVRVDGLPPANSLRFYAGAFANLFSPWPYSVSRHHTRRYSDTIRQLTASQKYDLLHCEWTPYASFIGAAIRGVPALIMAHNIEATIWRRRAEYASNSAERLYMKLQALKMSRFEKKCFSRVERVVVVTEMEQRAARERGARTTSLVPNGVDTEYLQPAANAIEPKSLLFLGSLDWQPNRDALQYLLSEILPRIHASNPDAILRVVGRRPAARLNERIVGIRGVEWIGEVQDIRPYFAHAAVVLVPLRIGGGSRIKILESMAMEKAVVTTAIGAEGLNVVSGEHCLIADSPADFADAIACLFDHPERAADLGRSGRKLVLRQYDWSQIALTLDEAWHETAGAALSHRPISYSQQAGDRQERP